MGLVSDCPVVPFIRILVLQMAFHDFPPQAAHKCPKKDAVLFPGVALDHWESHRRNSRGGEVLVIREKYQATKTKKQKPVA